MRQVGRHIMRVGYVTITTLQDYNCHGCKLQSINVGEGWGSGGRGRTGGGERDAGGGSGEGRWVVQTVVLALTVTQGQHAPGCSLIITKACTKACSLGNGLVTKAWRLRILCTKLDDA
jgi:hypothetical protein